MKIPMPSPRGTNHAGLYLRRPFFRGPAAAYDQAPPASQSSTALLRRKARRFFEQRWRADWENFCRATGLEDDDATDESVSEPQHNAIEAAAHTEPELEYGMGPGTEDELPEYGPNRLPRNNIAARRPGDTENGNPRPQFADVKFLQVDVHGLPLLGARAGSSFMQTSSP
jgi:hypothetical protein